jgi:uncharacterized protein (DUF924 family)
MPGTNSTNETVEQAWIGEVLRFWFEELGPSHWFEKSEVIDAQIRDRFLSLNERLSKLDGVGITTPRALLSAVIVLDQFSRNLFRGTPRAFTADPLARRLARNAVEQAFDGAMKEEERLFLYLPFEHSENPKDQALSVELFTRLGNQDWTRYAVAHKKIIDRFGRFVHRNAVLNRKSSAEEIEHLKDPMARF